MKKTIAALLLFALLLTMPIGCGGDKDPPASGPPGESAAPSAAPSEEPKTALDRYEKKDLGGYEFVIKTFDDKFFTPTAVTGPISEAMLERNQRIEEYFNVKIIKENGDYSLHWEEASPIILSGDKWADLIAPTMWMMSHFFTNDALLDLNMVKSMNLQADYYNRQVIEASTMFEKAYIFSSEACAVDEFVSGIAFNKQIVETLDLENPYDLVRQNKWTIDKYREMARLATKETTGDGEMTKDDMWGHTGPTGDYQLGLYSGGGFPMVGQDKDGRYTLLFNTPDVRDFLQKIKGLCNNDGTCFVKEAQADWRQVYDVFKAGRSLFVGHRIQEFFSFLRDMEQDWGIVPEPKMYPEQKNFSGWVDHNAPLMAIPKTTTEYEKAGLIIDAMSAVSEEIVKPARYEEWSGLYFRDPEEDLAMMEIIAGSAYYDTTYFVRNAIGEFNMITNILYRATEATGEFESAYTANEGVIQDAIDKFYKQGAYAE